SGGLGDGGEAVSGGSTWLWRSLDQGPGSDMNIECSSPRSTCDTADRSKTSSSQFALCTCLYSFWCRPPSAFTCLCPSFTPYMQKECAIEGEMEREVYSWKERREGIKRCSKPWEALCASQHLSAPLRGLANMKGDVRVWQLTSHGERERPLLSNGQMMGETHTEPVTDTLIYCPAMCAHMRVYGNVSVRV
ncbi:hypothetical protein KUCAC02_029879, partial [Chaenocephalus aceratus]